MAIYKLGEICNIKRGSSPRPINKWLRDKGLMWAKISDISKFSIMQTKQFIAKEWITKGLIGQKNDLFITNSATPGIPFLQLSNNPIAYHDGFVSIKPNKNLVSNKYLLYRLILDKSKLIKLGNGAIFVNLSCKIIGDWKVNIPSLKTQKQIIDIIEPIEKLILLTAKLIRKLNFICDNLTKINYKITSDKYQYHKGELPDGNGKTSFLNVSAANGNINRKVSNEPNIFQGDVTLSLDGNTGIVNRNLNGFNGYLYKVTSYKHKNYQIFFSLKHSYNQRIIKINETGTTIKHSPNSKKQIKHIEFYNDEFLAKCYNILNKTDDILILLNNQKIQMMKLLVK